MSAQDHGDARRRSVDLHARDDERRSVRTIFICKERGPEGVYLRIMSISRITWGTLDEFVPPTRRRGRRRYSRGVRRIAAAVLVAALGAANVFAQPTAWKTAFVENPILPPGFKQWELPRADGSRMTAFLAHLRHDCNVRKPLLVFLDGSGAQSLFVRQGDRLAVGMLAVIADQAGEAYHVVAVEKRGAVLGELGMPGSAQGASAEYQLHATCEDRAAEVQRLLKHLLDDPAVDASRVVLVGHSEGAVVAAAAAALEPRVTHVAFLSGCGPSQFFDLMVLRRRAMQKAGRPADEIERAVAQLEGDYRAILAEPESVDKTFMGHAYRRWASYGRYAATDDLRRTGCKLFLAHGTEDTSVSIESFDAMTTDLLRSGRKNVTVRRYAGRDHSLRAPDASPQDPPMRDVFDEILTWAKE